MAGGSEGQRTGPPLSLSPRPLAPFFAALKPALRDIREQRLRLVPVQPEDLPDQIADTLVPALEEHQNRRARAAQRAPEQSGRAQLQNFFEPGTSAARYG